MQGSTRLRLDRLQQLGILLLLLVVLIVARLAQLQILRHDELRARQTLQAQRQQVVPARRGRIVDRRGRALAFDVVAYDVSLLRRDVRRDDLPLIADALGLAPAALRKTVRAAGAFVTVAREVTLTPAAAKKLRTLPGVCLDQRNARQYPFGTLAAQYIGFTGMDGAGAEGVEKAFDGLLRGEPGEALLWTDENGNSIGQQIVRAPVDGADVVLSLDVDLQRIADDELQRAVRETGARGGSVLIVDPHTGDLLACANAPLPGHRSGAYEPHTWRNRAVYDQFEPGSTLKPITAVAALRHGVANFDTWIYADRGAASFGKAGIIRDAHREGYGWLSFTEAFMLSSNICFAKMAQRLTSEQLYTELRAFGFGSRTGLDLPVEPGGVLALPRDWSGRSRLSLGYGQEISVTAVQLAGIYTTIANGGRLLQPRVALRAVNPAGDAVANFPVSEVRRVLDADMAAALRDLCVATVAKGTARGASVAEIEVAGKTGTAEKAVDGRYVARYVASFGGFAPADDPRLACLVVLDEPRGAYHWGGQSAAPTFRRILEAIVRCTSFLEPDVDVVRVVRHDDMNDVTPLASPFRLATLDAGALPDLRGLDLRAAARWLQKLGLETDAHGAGVVRAQSPEPGERVARGNVVRIDCLPERGAVQRAALWWR